MRTRLVEPLRVGRVSAVLVAVLAAAIALGGVGDVTSVLVGGAFMLADFHLIRILVSRLIKPGAGPGLAFAGLGLKFLLVLALVVAVFRQWPVEPLSFAAGASMLLVAALLDAAVLGTSTETVET